MIKRTVASLLVLSVPFTVSPVWSDSLLKQVGDRVVVSGTKTYGLQMLSVSGSRDTFYNDNYSLSGRYRNETNLTFTGNVLPRLSLTASLSNNRWNPNDRTMSMNYDGRKTKAALGDINASLTGNELVSFSKRLKGAAITQNFGICSVTAIASQTKASTKTVTLAGNNTPGPYYLGASFIVDGSEHVKIDEKEILRTDSSGIANYTFDSFSGIITFRDSLIVPSTSTITVSFESQSYNSTPGTIWGMRTDVPINKDSGVGFTYLTQKSSKANDIDRLITEPFRGNNSLSLPYELLYIPAEGSVIVKVDGLPMAPDVDYTINYQLKYILFKRTITSNSTILVSYAIKPETAVQGDRTVMGFDAKYRVSEKLTLSSQLAKSSRDNTGNNDGGYGASIRALGQLGKLKYTANLKSISPTYASLESAGFFRNQRGGDVDFRYMFSDQMNCFTHVEHFRQPSYKNDSSDVTGTQSVTYTRSGVEWSPKKKPQIRLTRSTQDSSENAGVKDSLTTNALSANWDLGKISTSGELSRSSRIGAYTGSDGALISSNTTSNTSRLSMRYTPGERFSISGDLAGSKIKNTNSSTTNAKNYQLTASYLPIKTINVGLSYRVADSGSNYSTPYTGYTGGTTSTQYGTGYATSGFLPSYGLKSATRTISVGWNPSEKLSVDSSYNFSCSNGENSTNTSTKGLDFGLSYSPIRIFTFRGHISNQKGGFVSTGGNMSSNISFLSLNVGPIKKFELDLNYQKMLSGTKLIDTAGTLQNDNVDLNSLSAVLRRDIGGNRYLFTEYNNSSTAGMIANIKSSLAFGIEYPLNNVLGLKVDWRMIQYSDSKNVGYNYRANMLNAQIGARFR